MYVYFIKAGNRYRSPVKIGIARNVARRLETMQVGNHEKLTLVCAIKCNSREHAEAMEKRIHYNMRKRRIRGEWFYGPVNMRKAHWDVVPVITDEEDEQYLSAKQAIG